MDLQPYDTILHDSKNLICHLVWYDDIFTSWNYGKGIISIVRNGLKLNYLGKNVLISANNVQIMAMWLLGFQKSCCLGNKVYCCETFVVVKLVCYYCACSYHKNKCKIATINFEWRFNGIKYLIAFQEQLP
jgi:hypothetical protein